MPSFLGRHIAFCSHLLRCGGGPFACLRGVLSPRGPPFVLYGGLVRCGLDLGCALPAVLCPWSGVLLPLVRGPSLVVFLLCRCFCLRGCGCLSVVVVLLFAGGWASFCLSFVWLLSAPLPCRLLLPLPLRLVPCGVLVQFLRWSLPLGIWLLFVTAWLPCLTAGGVVVLCRPHFTLSHGSKGLWPCVGFVFPLHHDACVVRVLSTTTLSYSSSMIQVPHWTPLKLHYCYSW